jgi:hypothetical protein
LLPVLDSEKVMPDLPLNRKEIFMGDLLISYDEGISSIGWAVWKANGFEPELLATGAVDFPTDDCLASKRRQLCHLRRSIRSRRQCISQLGKLFLHLKLLSAEQIRANRAKGRDLWNQPWFIAARVLKAQESPTREGSLLTNEQLWDVLRWYAHNRGYFVPWAGHSDESDEDTRKVIAAKAMMEFHGKKTMAGTLCAAAGIPDPLNPPSTHTFAAKFVGQEFDKGKHNGRKVREIPSFPRADILVQEVRAILEAQRGPLEHHLKMSGYFFEKLVAAILEDWRHIPPGLRLADSERKDRTRPLQQRERERATKIWLPNRYEGGLLFGQRIPRFDNRIIALCPKSGNKTPLKQCAEFYEYRWAMLLANIKAGGTATDLKPLTKDQRGTLDARLRRRGFLKPGELKHAVKEITGFPENNVVRMFADTPESEKSLILQPVEKYLRSESELAHYLFRALPKKLQRNVRNALWRGKRLNVNKLREQLRADSKVLGDFDRAIELFIERSGEVSESRDTEEEEDVLPGPAQAARPHKRKATTSKKKSLTVEDLLRSSIFVPPLAGRAPYSREILKQVRKEVIEDGHDPRRHSKNQLKSEGRLTKERLERAEDKIAHGCLAGVEEITPKTLGICESSAEREAAYNHWRNEWLGKRNKNGEIINERRSEKYGESWVRRQYETQELEKWLAKKSNNHLVRQRMLILDRLTQDIVAEFGGGDVTRVGRIAIEVARDLVTFSGLTSKQRGGDDKGVMGSVRAQHRRVTRWLQQQLGEGNKHLINGSTIWLAKVAEDLNFRDPYKVTQPILDPLKLARREYQVDHIIPKSVRLTNAMEAVVLTDPEINKRKGRMTALEFIVEMNKPENIQERDRLGICSVQSYVDFVAALKTHQTGGDEDKSQSGANDGADEKTSGKINPKYLPGSQRLHPDYKRRKLRKKFLMIPEYNKENDSFTSRQLTNTSYLNRLAQAVLLRRFPHLGQENLVSIPGQVTKALRDSGGWSLFGCLGHRDVCGEAATRAVPRYDKSTRQMLRDEKGSVLMKRIPVPKEELRKLTHLHHAVDACALGLIAHWLPKHGKLWELLALAELTQAEHDQYNSLVQQFLAGELEGGQRVNCCNLNQLLTCYRIDDHKARRSPDPNRIYRLESNRTPEAKARMCRIRDQISRELAKKRVVQHIPAEHEGLPTDETIYRVVTGLEGKGRVVQLVCNEIEKQRHRLAELEGPVQQCQAKLAAFDEETGRLTDKVEQKARRALRKSLAKRFQEAKAKREAAKSLLSGMEDFERNAWIIKRVRVGSNGWKEITKRFESQRKDAHNGAAPAPTGIEGGADNTAASTKIKKLPKLLGNGDPGKDKALFVYDIISRSKLVSLPEVKGGKEVATNFGIAILDYASSEEERFAVIPWHKVWPRIHKGLRGGKSLREQNAGHVPRILRVGGLIRIKNTDGGLKDGIWMVRSAKATLKLDLSHVDVPEMKDSGRGIWREVALRSIGARNIEILPSKLTGVPQGKEGCAAA